MKSIAEAERMVLDGEIERLQVVIRKYHLALVQIAAFDPQQRPTLEATRWIARAALDAKGERP